MSKRLEKLCNHWTKDSIRLIHTPGLLARRGLIYLQEVGYFKTMPPYSTERANLPSFLLLYTLSGTGVLDKGGQRILLRPGECVLVDCMEHHHYFVPAGEKWEFLWAHFNGANSLAFFQAFQSFGVPCVPIEKKDDFAAAFWQIIHAQQEGTVSADIRINHLLVTILTGLLQQCVQTGKDPSLWPDYIHRAVQMMEERYFDPLTLEMVSAACGVSKCHLSREFHRQTGTCFADYLLRVRMLHAKKYLRFTDRTVGCIAQDCGFNDTSYFIRIFKQKEAGQTPMAYRRQWAEELRE